MKSLINLIFRHPLSGLFGLRGFGRFLSWQMSSRIDKRVHIHEWIEGTKFHVRSGETGLTGNIYVGLHEFADMGFLLHLLEPDDLFLDVGANSGSYTILASGVIGAKTTAFEPVPETFNRLLSNICINQLHDRVDAKQVGISSMNGVMQITTGDDTTNHFVSGETSKNVVSVEVLTLDSACSGLAPSLIKIDVEGWEMSVLSGAEKILSQKSLLAIILEINGRGQDLGVTDEKIVNHLMSYEFLAYRYDPLTRKISKITGRNFDGGNTIFIRNIDECRNRIQASPTFRVLGVDL